MFCNRGARVQIRVNLLWVDAHASDQLFRLCRVFHLGMNQLRVQCLSLLSLFSELGPGCVCCSTLRASKLLPALKVTLIRPGWLADWVFRHAVVICTSQNTSVFYKAYIKLVCVGTPPWGSLVLMLTAGLGIVSNTGLTLHLILKRTHVLALNCNDSKRYN